MSNSVYMKIEGIEKISAVLNGIPEEIKNSIMATAITEAAKPVVGAAKVFARRKSGALVRSISSVTRKYKKGAISVAVVGPDTGRYSQGKKLKSGDSFAGSDRPCKYAHLIEFGHAARDGGTVQAYPFMRPAVDTTGPAVGEAMANGIAKGIERKRAKLIGAK